MEGPASVAAWGSSLLPCAMLPSQQHAGLNSCLAHLASTEEHVVHQQTCSRRLAASTYHWSTVPARPHALRCAAQVQHRQVQVHGAAARQQGRGLLGSCAREGRPMLRGAQVSARGLSSNPRCQAMPATAAHACSCPGSVTGRTQHHQQQQAVASATAAEPQLFHLHLLSCLHTRRVTQTRAFDTEPASSSYASGFIVDKARGIILTNRHVVTPGTAAAVCLVGLSCITRLADSSSKGGHP